MAVLGSMGKCIVELFVSLCLGKWTAGYPIFYRNVGPVM